MTINSLLRSLIAARLSLDAFHESAGKGEALQVVQDGAQWKVRACAATARTELGVDTTAIFVEALGRAFSRRIQDAVVRELGLASPSSRPLPSRLVLQAIAMAETSRKAMQGVDFMTQLMFSAAAHSGAFVATCRELELSPDAISPQQRAAVDARMQERFAQAEQQGQFPVVPELAQQWLRAELSLLKTSASDLC